MGDQYIYEESFRADTEENEIFSSKQYIYINDSNNGVYSGNQVVFDLSQFFNSGKYISPKEMTLLLPIILVLDGSDAAGLGNCDFALACKSGFHHFIQSIQVSFRNQDVVQLSPNINYYVSYKLNTTFSRDDLETSKASQIGFYPDSCYSWKYKTGISLYGEGSTNNLTGSETSTPVAITAYPSRTYYNVGMFKRQLASNIRLSNAGADDGSGDLRTANSLGSEAMSYQTQVHNPNANDYNAIYITAIVRLKDLSEFFDAMPLVRGFYARLLINLNLGSLQVTVNAARSTMTCPIATNTFTNTCPFILSALTDANVPSGLSLNGNANASTLTIGAYLGKVTGTQSAKANLSHPISQARIYSPIIDLLPQYALSYNEANKMKLVQYDDVYSTSILGVGVNSPFNYLVAPTISNAKQIIVIPFVASTVNGANANSRQSPCVSPFSSEPGTTSPLLSITQFNVMVAGINVLQQNIQYTFEEFIQQVVGCNAINGGLSDGLSSGLINKSMFENNYRYYVVDLSRKSTDDIASKSINIVGLNNSNVAIDLYIFITYQRQIKINVGTGEIVP